MLWDSKDKMFAGKEKELTACNHSTCRTCGHLFDKSSRVGYHEVPVTYTNRKKDDPSVWDFCSQCKPKYDYVVVTHEEYTDYRFISGDIAYYVKVQDKRVDEDGNELERHDGLRFTVWLPKRGEPWLYDESGEYFYRA